jgi:uncharacterized damage-inducible protein DinB
MPEADNGQYPRKTDLLKELQHQHEKVKTILNACSEEQLMEPVKWRFSSYMPSLLDLVTFMCITHENMHLGQLACWRRAFGYPSALAML